MNESILFLRPNGKDNHAARNILRNFISSEGAIRIAVAYLSDSAVIEMLKERFENIDAPTYVILNTSDILRPVNAGESELAIPKALFELITGYQTYGGLEIRTLGRRQRGIYENMHHKFIVSDNAVAFGSMNWTNAALERNFECLVISHDRGIINAFFHEFGHLWYIGSELWTSYGSIRSISCPICNTHQAVDFESYGPFCTNCNHRFKIAD